MRRTVAISLLFALAWAFPAAAQAAAGDADVAALQVALKARGLYSGSVDGELGPGTEAALRRFQGRKGLVADGVAGRQTRLAFGRYGRRAPLGVRTLHVGTTGWDVASLQFLLAWHGFPSGNLDGGFGAQTDSALRAFQRWSGLPVDGRAGPATVAALRAAPPRSPIALAAPCAVAPTDRFGPRGQRFHTGLDYPAPAGSPVVAAAPGRVTQAGRVPGGWGRLVVIDHGQGVETWYAHLATVRVRVGQSVPAGAVVGLVGASGRATGPHLHFEVRLRGAAVDPLTAL
jgi:peptidoglycan hydrolase-like protein with peptidoglycan-binding domain